MFAGGFTGLTGSYAGNIGFWEGIVVWSLGTDASGLGKAEVIGSTTWAYAGPTILAAVSW